MKGDKMRYLVMESSRDYAILLDEEGRFLRAANHNYQVGDTITGPIRLIGSSSRTTTMARWTLALAAIAACLALVVGIRYYQWITEPYTTVYLSINPAVSIDFNRSGTVVRLEGLNPDGDALIEGYRGKGRDRATVATDLLNRAIELGFIHDRSRISFIIDAPDSELVERYGREFHDAAAALLSADYRFLLEVRGGTLDDLPDDYDDWMTDESTDADSPDTEATTVPERDDDRTTSPSTQPVIRPSNSRDTTPVPSTTPTLSPATTTQPSSRPTSPPPTQPTVGPTPTTRPTAAPTPTPTPYDDDDDLDDDDDDDLDDDD
ncbi:MAG: hypothetical protein QM270_03385 [Bacillota bacterium]|nr:hypothetical protein [Bacillota bacterium]